jgi:uncharacterized membrane protein
MAAMELLFLLLTVGLFALWISNRNLKIRIDHLEWRLGREGGQVNVAFEPVPAIMPVPASEPASGLGEPTPASRSDREPAAEPDHETVGALFERLVAGKLLIWLGAFALAIAGVFLVRHSIGLLTPGTRMIAAALFGLGLIAAGEYARAGKLLSSDPRFSQGLVGAGIAVLYAAAYGAHVLFGVIGTGAASAAMAAITAVALGLSLRHGAPTAIAGLAGGFVTPLLVGHPDASAVPLLAYLGLLNLAIFLISWRRGWTWLAAAAVALSFGWSAFLLARAPADALAAGIFVILLAVGAALVRPGGGRALGLFQPLLIGLVQLAFLAARADLGFLGWMQFGLLGLAAMMLAMMRAEYRYAPLAALALGLLVLLGKAGYGQDPFVLRAAGMLTLLFGLGGQALAWWKGGRIWTAVACGGLAGPLLIVHAAWPALLAPERAGQLAALLALGPGALVWRHRARADGAAPADLVLLTAGSTMALLAAAAVWNLAPADFVASGWIAVGLAVALAARRLNDLALGMVAAMVAALGLLRALAMVPELSVAFLGSLIGEPIVATDLPGAATALHALAIPAILLAATRLALPPLPLGALRAFLPVALLIAGAALYVWFKQAFALTDDADFARRGLIERTILTQALFAFGWLMASGHVSIPRIAPELPRAIGAALTALAALRLIWFDILHHNPVWAAQWVGTMPVLNLVLPAYLASACWLYAARRRASSPARAGLWLVSFLAALIGGAVLMVRQFFHGPWLDGPDLPIAEYYGYSLAGLVLSIALLLAGMRLPDKALRLAGLALLTATIAKVFLSDAAALEGVLRILSFLGLGIALIGIARLYGPILRAERAGSALAQTGESG